VRAVLRPDGPGTAGLGEPSGSTHESMKRIGTEEIMGASEMFDKAKDALNKAKDALSGHGDKADEAVDKVDQAVKDKTPDQADSVVDQAADKAKDAL